VIIREPPPGGRSKRTTSAAYVNRCRKRWNRDRGGRAPGRPRKRRRPAPRSRSYEEPRCPGQGVHSRPLQTKTFGQAESSLWRRTPWTTIKRIRECGFAPELVSSSTKYESRGIRRGSGRPRHLRACTARSPMQNWPRRMDRKVLCPPAPPLPPGGSLVIDRTEAMTVVDGQHPASSPGPVATFEQTVTKKNNLGGRPRRSCVSLLAAATTKIGGHRRHRLSSTWCSNPTVTPGVAAGPGPRRLARDRTRHQVSEVTSLGLVPA